MRKVLHDESRYDDKYLLSTNIVPAQLRELHNFRTNEELESHAN